MSISSQVIVFTFFENLIDMWYTPC